MTISSTTRKAGPYRGNGVTTAFPFGFKVFKKEDVLVTFTDANGTDYELVLDSDYSVTLNADQNNNPGGMIMLHGLPNSIQSESMRQQYANRDWTQGCIAVQNHEMDEIWSLVKDGTPIQIMP